MRRNWPVSSPRSTQPINIVAEGYTDLSIGLLRHERSFQAREFSGNIASLKPEDQAALTKLKTSLFDLYQKLAATR